MPVYKVLYSIIAYGTDLEYGILTTMRGCMVLSNGTSVLFQTLERLTLLMLSFFLFGPVNERNLLQFMEAVNMLGKLNMTRSILILTIMTDGI